MGSWNSQNNFESWIGDESLDYYMSVDDPNLGNTEIYTCSRKLPMSFIMKVKKGIGEGQQALQTLEAVQKIGNVHLIKLYECKKRKICLCSAEGSNEQLVSYWEYYNYYLLNLIERRQNRGVGFTEDELWHLVKVCCQGYLSVNSKGFWMDFDPQKLIITPEGKVKLFWAHLQPKNMHLKYLQYFVSGQLDYGYYSPEELECVRNKERVLRLDFQKANVYGLGMLLLYCITLTDPEEHIYRGAKIDFSQLDHIIKTFKQKAYSKQLWSLVDSCLAIDPRNRCKFTQIHSKFSEYFNEDFGVSLASTQIDTEGSSSKADFRKTRISLRRKGDKNEHLRPHF